MIAEQDLVALFHSMHRVLAAEKSLKEAGIEFLLIPAPRELSSACGLAIRFSADQRQRIEAILQEADLLPRELHVREAEGYRQL
jgi:hypothetical protein